MIIKKESQESGSGVSIYVTKSSVSRACTFSLTLSLSLCLAGLPSPLPQLLRREVRQIGQHGANA